LGVDGYGCGMVKALEVGCETVDATGLLSQGGKERIHLAAARDGVGQVPRLALRRFKVSPDSLACGLATAVFGLRLEVVLEQTQRALRDVAVDEGRDRAKQGRVDRVLRAVADAAADRATVHAVLVADVREVVAFLRARYDEARAADRAPEKRGSQMPRRGHSPSLPARLCECGVDLREQRSGPDSKLRMGDVQHLGLGCTHADERAASRHRAHGAVTVFGGRQFVCAPDRSCYQPPVEASSD
jgi:hypothetical protein